MIDYLLFETVSLRILEPVPQVFGDFFSREAQLLCFGQKLVFEFPHLALSILLSSYVEMPRFYKGANTAPSFDDPRSLELEVYLRDCVGVYAKIDCKLPDSGQPISRGKLADGDGKPNRAIELMIDRRRMRSVDVKS
jgi:hypothetical protein